MDAKKGLGTVCRCFRGHTQPPIGLQPPGHSINGPTRKRDAPQLGKTRLDWVDPSEPRPLQSDLNNTFAPGTKVNKATSSHTALAQRQRSEPKEGSSNRFSIPLLFIKGLRQLTC